MSRLLISLILSMMSVVSYCQTESAVASRWLASHGGRTTGYVLSVAEDYEELVVLEDAMRKAFVIVARDAYSDRLSNRVLAYSADNVFSNPEGSWTRELTESYRSHLRSIRDGVSVESCYDVYGKVAPLMDGIKWGQGWPFNKRCPFSVLSNNHKLAGCVSVAMSQVMFYHRFPTQGRGGHRYTWNGTLMSEDFGKLSPRWENMRGSYGTARDNSSDADGVAELIAANAVAVNSDFDLMSTSSSILFARSALVDFWGYSPRCGYAHGTTTECLSGLMRRELVSSRPVICAGGGHAFVCDGMDGGFLHLNLGWGGAGNGYYRCCLCEDGVRKCDMTHIVSELVYNIMPGTREVSLTKIVTVPKEGMLSAMLSVAERAKVRRLKVTGRLNGDDIRLLRLMAGAEGGAFDGSLVSLDLSDAEIVTDKVSVYCRMPADGCQYTIGKNVYDFSDMTGERFRRFKKSFAASGRGYRFVEYDGRYFVDFHTVTKTIGAMMFSDCCRLAEVLLPKTVTRIQGHAFLRCSSLREVELPKAVREVETGAFSHCHLLKMVVVNGENVREVTEGLSPVKVNGKYGTVSGGKHCGVLDGVDAATCEGVFVRKGQSLVRLNSL